MLPLYCLNLAFKISLDLFKPLTANVAWWVRDRLDGGTVKKRER